MKKKLYSLFSRIKNSALSVKLNCKYFCWLESIWLLCRGGIPLGPTKCDIVKCYSPGCKCSNRWIYFEIENPEKNHRHLNQHRNRADNLKGNGVWINVSPPYQCSFELLELLWLLWQSIFHSQNGAYSDGVIESICHAAKKLQTLKYIHKLGKSITKTRSKL